MPKAPYDETTEALDLTFHFDHSVVKLTLNGTEHRIDLGRLSPEAWGKLIGADSVKPLKGAKVATKRGYSTDVKAWRQIQDISRDTPELTFAAREKAIEGLYSGEIRTKGEALSLAIQGARASVLTVVKVKHPSVTLAEVPKSFGAMVEYLQGAGLPKAKAEGVVSPFADMTSNAADLWVDLEG